MIRMLGSSSCVIGDADGLVSLLYKEDCNHLSTIEFLDYCERYTYDIFFPVTAIMEALTVFHKKIKSVEHAFLLKDYVQQKRIMLIDVSDMILFQALSYFDEKKSKNDTIFDCVVLSLAKANESPFIFSYDSFYKKRGQRIIPDAISGKRK